MIRIVVLILLLVLSSSFYHNNRYSNRIININTNIHMSGDGGVVL